VGCNHKGDMGMAIEMIKIAAQYCQVDGVKFQKRNNLELLTKEEFNAPHPVPENSYGRTYGEHREALEFTQKLHRDLMRVCEDWAVDYSVSVWDMTSAKEMAELKPSQLKIPSACNLNFEMLGWLCKNYDGELHLSLGMTTRAEEQKIVNFFQDHGRAKDLILYACTSGYPVPFEDICLHEIARLKEQYGPYVKEIGFSGHHLGIAADIAAMTLGATVIERHFTLDRTWKGTDHAASLEPDGLRKLCRDVHHVEKALSYKGKEILGIEEVQRKKLKRCL